MGLKALLIVFPLACSSLCLEDGVGPEQRLYLNKDMPNAMPIGILQCDWESGALLSLVTKLLLQEALGYHAEIGPVIGANGASPIYGLAGCTNFDSADRMCGVNETKLHINVDAWVGSYASAFEQMHRDWPTLAPIDLGTMGYDGEESIYLSNAPLQEAQSEGLALDFYKSYNTSHHDTKKYFGSISDIPIEEIFLCNATEFFNVQRMTDYAIYSGDYAGVEQTSDGTVAKCRDGHWWMGPACRHNPADCIPAVTAGNGWKLQAIMQWVAAYGMPCAVGISRGWGNFTKHVRGVRVLHYWWVPDSTFIDMEPVQVVFPRHSAIEWSQGDKKTSAIGSRVAKMVSRDLASKARVVQEFIAQFNFELSEVQSSLFELNKLKSTQPENALYNISCNWIRDNRPRWTKWIPIQTNCYAGYGVVDGSSRFVWNRTGAVRCTVCPAGTYSEEFVDDDGTSYRCTACPIGTSQADVLSTSCTPCGRGTFADSVGSVNCKPCAEGYYKDFEGEGSCIPCHAERTTRLLAATAPDECVCKAQSIESEGRCVSCPAGGGLWCPIGSTVQKLQDAEGTSDQSVPYVEEGHFSLVHQPLSIYKCTESCPGGPPGKCAGGTTGLTCRMCPSGQTLSGGECTECGGQTPGLMLSAVIGGLLLGITVSYYAFSNNYIAKASPMFRAMSIFDVGFLICQVLGLLQIAWSANSFGSEVSWTRVFLLDLDGIGVSCTLEGAVLQYAMVAALWWVFPAMVFSIFCILRCTRCIRELRRRKLEWKVVPTVNLTGKFMQVAFTTIANIGLMPFVCYQHPNGEHSVRRFSNVLCGSEDHFMMQIFGSLVLLLAIFYLSLCLLWTLMAPSFSNTSERLGYANFLIKRFRPAKYWFGLFLLFRGPLLSLPAIVAADSQTLHLSLMFLVLITSLCLQSWNQPWKSHSLNLCDAFSVALLLSLIAVSMGCMDSKCSGSVTGLWYTLLVFLLSYLIIFLATAGLGVAGSFIGGSDMLTYGRPRFHEKLVILGDLAEILADNEFENLIPVLEELCTYDAQVVSEAFDILLQAWEVPHRPYFSAAQRISSYMPDRPTLSTRSVNSYSIDGHQDFAAALSSRDIESPIPSREDRSIRSDSFGAATAGDQSADDAASESKAHDTGNDAECVKMAC